MTGESIFIVEDDGVIALRMQEMLTKSGYIVPDPVAFGEDALEQIAKIRPSLVLMDIELMGEIDGIDTARLIHERYEIPVIYLTAYVDDHRLARAKETAPYGYIVKPFMDRELLATIDMAFHRHALDRKLKESEERYHAVIDKAAEGIIIFDPEGHVKEANPALGTLLGYSREEVFGLTLPGIFAGTPAEVQAAVGHVLSEEGFVGESRLLCHDGTVLDVEIASGKIPNSAEKHLISLVAHDITERKRSATALRQANRKLQFLTQITRHDIANSLTVVIGYNEFLRDLVTDEKAQEYLAKQEVTLKAINRQIQFTKLYEDIGSQSPLWISLDTAIDNAKVQFDPSLFTRDFWRPHTEIFADPLFEKVFFNLFENAIRHGGGIKKIILSMKETDTGLVVTVQDDGKGVPPENKPKIFHRGFGSNTGLGLYMSREILDITHISIDENGQPGSGARFEILVPKGSYRTGDSAEKSK